VLPAPAVRWPALAGALDLRLAFAPDQPAVLTFDDGPHPIATARLLDTLDELRVKAVFFLVGEQVARHPSAAREIAGRGHLVGLHCMRHRNLLRLTPGQAVRDIRAAEREIGRATGSAPTLYRPPYGILSGAARAYVRARGWQTWLWSAWGRDWRAAATAETVTRDVLADLAPGGIVLLHDADYYGALGSWRATLDAVPAIVEGARDRGVEFGLPA